jgi:hypothetical protein
MGAIRMGPIRSGRLGMRRMSLAVVPETNRLALNRTTEEFGIRVRNRRIELGFSQEAAALRCGHSLDTAWES